MPEIQSRAYRVSAAVPCMAMAGCGFFIGENARICLEEMHKLLKNHLTEEVQFGII